MIVICLQFCPQDRPRAMELARLIAANESKPRSDAMFCFVNRFDTTGPDPVTFDAVNAKFYTEIHRTTTEQKGWPQGCNAMAIDTLRHAEWSTRFGSWHEATGIMLLEPDCIPVQKEWIDRLVAEWKPAFAAGKWIMGTWRDGGGELGHINGNCIVRPDFAQLVNFNGIPEWLAWDCALSEQVHKHWHITHLICNRWKETNLSDVQIITHRDFGDFPFPVLVHGCKDDSVWNYAKRTLAA